MHPLLPPPPPPLPPDDPDEAIVQVNVVDPVTSMLSAAVTVTFC
ncbi:MAG TPA: hypothetical protein VGG75_05770 [Trebonia sp.]